MYTVVCEFDLASCEEKICMISCSPVRLVVLCCICIVLLQYDFIVIALYCIMLHCIVFCIVLLFSCYCWSVEVQEIHKWK
jgi:hypothetical protein